MDFHSKNALITGGSSGIGLATACLLVEYGANVCLLARDPQRLAEARSKVEAARRSSSQWVDILTVDVTDAAAVNTSVTGWLKQRGPLDLLINSAGFAHTGYVEEIDMEIIQRTMDINYFGAVHMIRAVLPGMLARRAGHIVNISSAAGFLGIYGYSAYCASKYAVAGYSDTLRAEVKPKGVKVSIVFPSDTQTPQLEYEKAFRPPELNYINPAPSLMTAEQVARDILVGIWRSRYVILSGSDSKLFYYLSRLANNLTYPVMDFLVRDAMRKVQKDKAKTKSG